MRSLLRGVTWQIGQLSVHRHRRRQRLWALRLPHVAHVAAELLPNTNVNGLGACRSPRADGIKCALRGAYWLCHPMLRVLELCGCPRLANIAPLPRERLEHLSLNGCTALSDRDASRLVCTCARWTSQAAGGSTMSVRCVSALCCVSWIYAARRTRGWDCLCRTFRRLLSAEARAGKSSGSRAGLAKLWSWTVSGWLRDE